MTLDIDITDLVKRVKKLRIRFYPTFTYVVSTVLNESNEFKMSYDEDGNLGVYDIIYPRYPIFHESDRKISILWTEYSNDFKVFYNRFIDDINTYGKNRSMSAKRKFPPNCFDMSSLPWSSFKSFNCPPTSDIVWLPPFVMVGRFFERDSKLWLPISISVHHSVCDGYHVSMFFKRFQELCKDLNSWLRLEKY